MCNQNPTLKRTAIQSSDVVGFHTYRPIKST